MIKDNENETKLAYLHYIENFIRVFNPDINKVDKEGNTPLHIAATMLKKNLSKRNKMSSTNISKLKYCLLFPESIDISNSSEKRDKLIMNLKTIIQCTWEIETIILCCDEFCSSSDELSTARSLLYRQLR